MDQHQLNIFWDLLSALGVGLLIGIERGWSGRKEDEGDRVAGIRTFSLTGLLGGIWTEIANVMSDWILAIIFLAFSALVITSYVIEANTHQKKDIGITTEVALLITFSLGSWSAFGYYTYALGTAVIVVALLNLKPVFHQWLKRIEIKEIYAGIKLLVISVILLPLLPNQGYGPWNALNPYWIWWMVVLISGLSFIGYFLMKNLGERLGTILTAITGAIASSTAVTLSLAQFAKSKKSTSSSIFIAGVLAASSIMFIRVLIEVAVVNPNLLYPLWIHLSVMLVVAGGTGVWIWEQFNHSATKEPTLELKNPLQFFTALQFGLLLAFILLLATALEKWYGTQGVYVLALFSGLMDIDAITLSLSRMAQSTLTTSTATIGIVISVITNTLVKAALFTFWVGYRKSKVLIWVLLSAVLAGLLSLFLFN